MHQLPLPQSTKVKRAAIYIRVSTSEQVIHGKSLEAQLGNLQRYADEHGMHVVGVFADEGQTARKELKKRKAIHQLLEAVKRDEIDVILFWRMDRWFRSVSDFYKVQDILDAHGASWVSTSEPNINMETRDGRLNLNLVLTIGQNEVDTTSERILFTVDSMIRNGRIVWGENNLPMGYTIAEVDGHKRIVKKESEAPMVEAFFHYFLQHQNKRRTVLYMQETFGIDFTYSKLKTMLSSEFYIGKYRGNTNYCPAYLTIEQWEAVQRASHRNAKMQSSGRIYYFSGLLRCPVCGQKLSGTGSCSISSRKTGEKKYYCYYRCNKAIIDRLCTNRYKASQNLLESYLLENLYHVYQDYRMRVEDIASRKQQIRKAVRSQAQIQQEMRRLNQLFIKGRLPEGEYEESYAALDRELKKAMAESQEKPSAASPYIETLLRMNLSEMYETLTPENRQAFWRSIIDEIHIDTQGNVISVDFR